MNASKTANKKPSAKGKKFPETGVAQLICTFNNTKLYIYDQKGNMLHFSSGGAHQRGANKGNPQTAEEIGKEIGERLFTRGMQKLEIKCQGNGSGNARDNAIRGIAKTGITITKLIEVTRDPHNGVRKKKRKKG